MGDDVFAAGVDWSFVVTVAAFTSVAAGAVGVWFASAAGAAELMVGAVVVGALVNDIPGIGVRTGAVRCVETK